MDDDPLRPAVSRHDRPDQASDGDGWPASAALGVATPFSLIGKGGCGMQVPAAAAAAANLILLGAPPSLGGGIVGDGHQRPAFGRPFFASPGALAAGCGLGLQRPRYQFLLRPCVRCWAAGFGPARFSVDLRPGSAATSSCSGIVVFGGTADAGLQRQR